MRRWLRSREVLELFVAGPLADQPYRVQLQRSAELVELNDLLPVEGPHEGAAVGDDGEQAFVGQALDRLPAAALG